MSSRRVHQRFAVRPAAPGQIRIAREVLVQPDDASNDIVAVGDAPAAIGERLILRLVGSNRETELNVIVVDARPLVVDGSLRHWMRLSVAPATAGLNEQRGVVRDEPAELGDGPCDSGAAGAKRERRGDRDQPQWLPDGECNGDS